jgi:hypothetical protein
MELFGGLIVLHEHFDPVSILCKADGREVTTDVQHSVEFLGLE